MEEQASPAGWRELLERQWIPTLAILMSGVLLQSMNALLLTTVLPSIVAELDGASLLSLPASAYVGAAIVAASSAGVLTSRLGVRTALCSGVSIFGLGALICSVAPSMEWVVVGRVVQGLGGGLEVGAAYAAVRSFFPPVLWPRVIALLSTSWTFSVLVGPLVGGLFADAGHWRGAFVTAMAAAAVLVTTTMLVLPPAPPLPRGDGTRVPAGRIGLICLAIATMSSASLVQSVPLKAGLVLLAVATLALMLRIDRRSATRLLPGDAFSLRTSSGLGLWLALLLCITFSPLHIYLPIFLQRLRGLTPLEAGFMVASGSLAWTIASVAVSGAAEPRQRRLILAGPLLMAAGLAALATLLASTAPTYALIPAIIALGAGIGQSWPFVGPIIMNGAGPGDGAVAASAVPTVQQTGFALGAALAGVVANASGFSSVMAAADFERAAFRLFACFIVAAALAVLISFKLARRQTGRSAIRLEADR
jgi:MFS family permease